MATATQEQKSTERGYRARLAFWKPYQGKGACALFEFDAARGFYFLKMMPENPEGAEKQFNKDAAINVKIGLTDLGEFMVVLTGQADGIGKKNDKGFYSGLFHKTEKFSSTIGLAKNEKNENYSLSVSKKIGSGDATRFTVSLTAGERAQLRLFFENPMHPSFADRMPVAQAEAKNEDGPPF